MVATQGLNALHQSSRLSRAQRPSPLRILNFPRAPAKEDGIEAQQKSPASHATPSWRRLPAKEQLLLLFLASFADYYQMAAMHTYMVHQIRSFDVAQSDASVSRKAGLLLGSCSAATIVTAVLWGRAADKPRLGRRGVILIGLACSALSSLGIGFSTSFVALALFTLLGGTLNGIPQSVRASLVESVSEEYQSRAVLVQPAAFFLANTFGPAITALMTDPYTTWPTFFASNGPFYIPFHWMKCHPFALPGMASALLSLLVAVFVAKRLDETLVTLEPDPSRRFAAPRKLWPWSRTSLQEDHRVSEDDQLHRLLDAGEEDDSANDFSSRSSFAQDSKASLPTSQVAPTSFLNRDLLLAFASLAILDFHIGGFNNLWLLLLTSARSTAAVNGLPIAAPTVDAIHFTGGLHFTVGNIGLTLSLIGLLGTIFQLLCYPRLQARLGLVRLFRFALFLFPIAYYLAPYIVLLPSTSPASEQATGFWIWGGIVGILGVQVMARAATVPAITLLLKDSAGSLKLATVYGIGQSVSSLFRSLGPVTAGWVFAAGVKEGVLGLAFWLMAAVSLLGCAVGLGLKMKHQQATLR